MYIANLLKRIFHVVYSMEINHIDKAISYSWIMFCGDLFLILSLILLVYLLNFMST